MKSVKEDNFWNDSVKNSKKVFKKGDRVRTRKGNIETVLRVNSNGNVETEENDYSWPPQTLTKVSESKKIKEIEIENKLRRKIRSMIESTIREKQYKI